MQDHEQALLVYLKLALVSQEKQQSPGAQRFLSLAAIAATEAGLPVIAEVCRQRILQLNPRNFVGKHENMPVVLRHPDSAPWRKHLSRFCSFEQAEHLLQNHQQLFTEVEQLPDIETQATALLNAACWLEPEN